MSGESLFFEGVAHPAPKDIADKHKADLPSAEIAAMCARCPVHVEHDDSKDVGRITTSWEHRGQLKVAGVLDDPEAVRAVRSGEMRGLSLGTNVMLDTDGRARARTLKECSIVATPARPGCYLDKIDGRRVLAVHCASGAGARPPARHLPAAAAPHPLQCANCAKLNK